MASLFQLDRAESSTTFYHIHLSTHKAQFLLGEVFGEHTQLNSSGQIAADEWQQIAVAHQRDITLDLWTVLPNGVRALVAVGHTGSPIYSKQQSLKPRALSSFVAGFKAAAAKRINLIRGVPGAPVWERGYQEQRISDTKTLDRVRRLLTTQAAGLIVENTEIFLDASQLSPLVE
ncbi:MAG: hypothetical protein ACFB2W_15660 [Leptolyngbyaceae cyanobacterium]